MLRCRLPPASCPSSTGEMRPRSYARIVARGRTTPSAGQRQASVQYLTFCSYFVFLFLFIQVLSPLPSRDQVPLEDLRPLAVPEMQRDSGAAHPSLWELAHGRVDVVERGVCRTEWHRQTQHCVLRPRSQGDWQRSRNAAEAVGKRCERHCRRSVFLPRVVALASGIAAGATGKRKIALVFAELLSATRHIGPADCILPVCGRARHPGDVEARRGCHEPPFAGGDILGGRRILTDRSVGYSWIRRCSHLPRLEA